MILSELYDLTVDYVRASLRDRGPAWMVSHALSYDRTTGAVSVCGEKIGAGFSRIFISGFGKCAPEMARGAIQAMGEAVDSGVLISRDDLNVNDRVRVLASSHPVPDERTIASSSELLRLHTSAPPDSLIICLVSGGGSSLFELPAPGLTLQDISKTTRLLLNSGASISEINAVRKRLSSVKGGKLLEMTRARLVTLAVSDVLDGGGPADIASGPTFSDAVFTPEAFSVLEKYELLADIPEAARAAVRDNLYGTEDGSDSRKDSNPDDSDALRERSFAGTDREISPNRQKPSFFIVGDSSSVIRSLEEKFAGAGFNVSIYKKAMTGEMSTEAIEFLETLIAAGEKHTGITCLIAPAEMPLEVVGEGRGGRNQHFALVCLKILQNPVYRSTKIAVAALASDGIEAFTDSAGAFVSLETAVIAEQNNIFAADHLGDFTSYDFFEKVGGHIRFGPTGHNVNDIVIGFYIN